MLHNLCLVNCIVFRKHCEANPFQDGHFVFTRCVLQLHVTSIHRYMNMCDVPHFCPSYWIASSHSPSWTELIGQSWVPSHDRKCRFGPCMRCRSLIGHHKCSINGANWNKNASSLQVRHEAEGWPKSAACGVAVPGLSQTLSHWPPRIRKFRRVRQYHIILGEVW